MRKGRDGGTGKENGGKKKTDENSGHYVVCQQSTARTTTTGTPHTLANCSKLILHCPQCISIKLFLHSIHQLIKLRNRVNFPNSTLFLEWWQQFCFLHHLEKHDYLKFSLDQSQKGPKLICWILTLQFLPTKTRLESGSAWKVWIQCFVCHILVW